MKNIRWSLLSTASGLLVQLFNLSNSLSIAAFRASLSGMKVFIYEVAKAGRGEILKKNFGRGHIWNDDSSKKENAVAFLFFEERAVMKRASKLVPLLLTIAW